LRLDLDAGGTKAAEDSIGELLDESMHVCSVELNENLKRLPALKDQSLQSSQNLDATYEV
jgi:hypothetical protein